MRFAVFSHVEHTERQGSFYGYGPYIREMNIWSKAVREMEVVAPLAVRPVLDSELAYEKQKLVFTSVPCISLASTREVLWTLLKLPMIIFRIIRVMYRSDHLHLRCPGNIGLLACLLQIFFPGKPKTAKYAGNWNPFEKQPWSYRIQKWLLSNTFLTRNMKVLVYGEWPEQTTNIIPFFTASFTEKDALTVKTKAFNGPYLFLFVGNLVPGKHPAIAVGVIKYLRKNGIPARLEIYGDGSEKSFLKALVLREELEESVQFMGNRSQSEIKRAYQRAHFLILASDSEGWPKAVSEAMFYRCIPIATAVSCVPWMLGYEAGEGQLRGILLKKNNFIFRNKGTTKRKHKDRNSEYQKKCTIIADLLTELLKNREEMKQMSQAAKKWSQQYTLEKFEEGIKEVLGLSEERKTYSSQSEGSHSPLSGINQEGREK